MIERSLFFAIQSSGWAIALALSPAAPLAKPSGEGVESVHFANATTANWLVWCSRDRNLTTWQCPCRSVLREFLESLLIEHRWVLSQFVDAVTASSYSDDLTFYDFLSDFLLTFSDCQGVCRTVKLVSHNEIRVLNAMVFSPLLNNLQVYKSLQK